MLFSKHETEEKLKGVLFSWGCSKSKSVRNEIWVSQVCEFAQTHTAPFSLQSVSSKLSVSRAYPPPPQAPPPPLIGWPTEVAMEICVVGQACEMKGADFEWPNPLWYYFICTKTQISDHAILVCTVMQPNQQISLLGFFFVHSWCPNGVIWSFLRGWSWSSLGAQGIMTKKKINK